MKVGQISRLFRKVFLALLLTNHVVLIGQVCKSDFEALISLYKATGGKFVLLSL
jgi:hypothetical protein